MASPPPVPTVLRAVSLDFDDTLIESEAMKRAALVRVAAAFAGGGGGCAAQLVEEAGEEAGLARAHSAADDRERAPCQQAYR